MRPIRVMGFVLSGLLLVTAFSSASSAQIRQRQTVLRWMGQGFGDGYHQCNRGPNSDYYNPYSPHNSLLQSQLNPYAVRDSDQYDFDRFPTKNVIPHPAEGTHWQRSDQFDSIPDPVIDTTFGPLDPPESRPQQNRKSDHNMNVPGGRKVPSPPNSSFGFPAESSATHASPNPDRGLLKSAFRTRPTK